MFFQADGYWLKGAHTYGYTTSLQTASFKSGTKYNVFVMKYLQTKPTSYSCVTEATVDISKAGSLVTSLSVGTVYTSSSLTLGTGTNQYVVYSSPYSGAFSLLDTMYIPRACAYISVNMTQMNYFNGQWASTY